MNGHMPIRSDITVIPGSCSKKKLNWKITETVGMVIINDAAIETIDFYSGDPLHLYWEDMTI